MTLQSEFAQYRLLSFLFAIRVPSGTLGLIRSFRGDSLGGVTNQKAQA